METLKAWGFSPFFSAGDGETVGRVTSQGRDVYRVVTGDAELFAVPSGKCRDGGCLPAVGDFVTLNRSRGEQGHALILRVLPRKSVFERKAAGAKAGMQVVAANVDVVFICTSLNNDFNLRRLERYLAIAWSSGAQPVVVLTKSDLCEDAAEKTAQAGSVAIGADVIVTSGFDAASLAQLRRYLKDGVTAAFVGSSGVGKSTLINALLGRELLPTAGLRRDDKGRHTTTRRELIRLPQGGVVLDTPGMRELGLDVADVPQAFADIDALARHCRFHDCTHTAEPGCAVKAAVAQGTLDADRLNSYFKLKKEARYDGLNSRQIEKEKISVMFADFGGIKNAKRYIKDKNKH